MDQFGSQLRGVYISSGPCLLPFFLTGRSSQWPGCCSCGSPSAGTVSQPSCIVAPLSSAPLQELEAQLVTMRAELAEAQELRGEVEGLGEEALVLEVDQTVAGLQVR